MDQQMGIGGVQNKSPLGVRLDLAACFSDTIGDLREERDSRILSFAGHMMLEDVKELRSGITNDEAAEITECITDFREKCVTVLMCYFPLRNFPVDYENAMKTLDHAVENSINHVKSRVGN